MIRTIPLILAISVMVLVSQANETFAVEPFTWAKYTAKDGKEYNYPRWNDNAGKRELDAGTGTLNFKQMPPVTKVVFRSTEPGHRAVGT